MTTHLIRISEVFADLVPQILEILGAENVKWLSDEYLLIRTAQPGLIEDSAAARFIRFHVPITHSWPCNPEKMESFIEKAAQSLYYKFECENPQTMLVGLLDPGSPKRYYKALGSNLRGRALQVFELPEESPKTAEEQNPQRETLFCFIGKKGLFAGIAKPIEAGGLHPGGTKFIAQNEDDTISRAGAKIAEGLHFISMHRKLPWKGAHWLELGASPGGMTSELLKRGYEVSAIDRAPLDPKISNHTCLTFIKQNVAEFIPPRGIRYNALLCDMNGSPLGAIEMVTRFRDFLSEGSLVVFTLKTTGVSTVEEIDQLEKDVVAHAKSKGFSLLERTHLTYNRQEFTCFFVKD